MSATIREGLNWTAAACLLQAEQALLPLFFAGSGSFYFGELNKTE